MAQQAQAAAGPAGHSPVSEVSRGGKDQNAEVEQAVSYPYVYETWIGCGGIGFARSADGGQSFGRPVQVPGSAGMAGKVPGLSWVVVQIGLSGVFTV